ncbi:MAG: ParB N-terminal domain-containing protein [Lachnospiraceae bacterium]|nr:ParB N-terminal domain-containing protein [Lachnospiraceae bacterium]
MPSMTDFLTAPKSVGDKQIKTTIRNIDYKKLFESPFQYRKFSDSDVSKLASLILMDGRVLEPLIVRKKGGDSFEILSGHKRHSACKYLVEELGEEQFSMIPCSVLELDDIKAEFCVYSTNGYGVKTSYEQMKEIEGMTKLLTEHKDSFPRPKGKRTVEIIAEELNLSRSTVTDFQTISHNLGEKGMEKFKNGEINKSAAVELSKVSEKSQEEILSSGAKTTSEIKEKVSKKKNVVDDNKKSAGEENISLPGQIEMDIPEYKEEESKSIEKTEEVVKVKNIEFREDAFNFLPSKNSYVGECPYCNGPVVKTFNRNNCGVCGNKLIWED